MSQWEREIYQLIDQLINEVIIDKSSIFLLTTLSKLNNIYYLIKERYPDKSREEQKKILNQLIKTRLPHPAVLLSFPSFKENIDYIMVNYQPTIAQNNLPSFEWAIKILYPKSKIMKDVKIDLVTVNYFLPAESLAFIVEKSIYEYHSFIYCLKKRKLKCIFLTAKMAINHHEIKRQIIYQNALL